MEVFTLKNLSFKYSGADKLTLKDINLSINHGDFLVIIGESGSGKTTLLKMLKKELTPKGEASGELFFKGKNIEHLTLRESAEKIGYVMQDPDSQIVTDKVYSELAFGLENLGYKNEAIRSKVSEFASYFGLSKFFNASTYELSGGEKQLLNLASVMSVNPEVVILDEPSSMLDPISAIEFFNLLKRFNEEHSTTVIIAEHHLNEVFPIASRALYLKDGCIAAVDTPERICKAVRGEKIEYTLPTPARVFNRFEGDGEAPLTIRDGRNFLKDKKISCALNSDKEIKSDAVLTLKNVFFRYERNSPDIIKGLDLTVYKGEKYSLVGANGSGKTTLISLVSQRLKPYRGRIKRGGRVSLLPQNPKDLFVKDRLEDDFKSVSNSYLELCEQFGIASLLNSHPYDLSGGELQRAAFVKALLSEPDILLLDEPTKGLDCFMKQQLGELIHSLKGVTVLIVTHDIEFAARYSDRCGLLFGSEITSEDSSRGFFLANSFYTTPVVKLTVGIADGAVNIEDLVYEE